MADFLQQVAFVFLMVGCTCAVGIAVGYPAAHWIGRYVGDMLSCLPKARFSKPQPALGIPRTMAMRGDFQGAAERYELLLLEHPAEKEIHFRLLEIVTGPLNDPDYGKRVVARGLEYLEEPGEKLALIHLADDIESGRFRPFSHPVDRAGCQPSLPLSVALLSPVSGPSSRNA